MDCFNSTVFAGVVCLYVCLQVYRSKSYHPLAEQPKRKTMFSLKGGSLISLCILGVIILSSFANGQLQCPVNEVTVLDNGTILFGPLSAGSGPVDASYDPGAIGGWNSLASGFIDAVQSRPLPFG